MQHEVYQYSTSGAQVCATILEEQLHSLETALATDEQQAQTIKPPTTEERRDQRRPDLEEDNDFDIHM